MASEALKGLIQQIKEQPRATNVAELRERLDGLGALFPLGPEVEVEKVSSGGVVGEWLTPPGVAPQKVLLYFHGGYYAAGSLGSHRMMVATLATHANAKAFSVDYQLAPKHPFPAALNDALGAYRWLLEKGLEPGRIVLGGDSAGGGLAVALMLALREENEPLPAAAGLISPWTDMTFSGKSVKEKAKSDPLIFEDFGRARALDYGGAHDLSHPHISPLFGDLKGFPPLMVQVGTAEILLDDSSRLADKARKAGVEVTYEPWDDMVHVFQLFAPLVPEGAQALERLGGFLKDHLSS